MIVYVIVNGVMSVKYSFALSARNDTLIGLYEGINQRVSVKSVEIIV